MNECLSSLCPTSIKGKFFQLCFGLCPLSPPQRLLAKNHLPFLSHTTLIFFSLLNHSNHNINMVVCPNQKQISKSLSLFPHGPITAPISLLFIAKFLESVVSTWCLQQIEQNKHGLKWRLTKNIQTKALRNKG